jgi:hypothetical protein
VVQQLREAKQSGQPLEAAIQKTGVKTEKVAPFSLIEEEKPKSEDKEPKKNEPTDLPAIKQAVAFLNPGEVSDFFPAGENGFVAILEKREPLANASASEKRAAFEKRLLDNKRRIVLMEWLRDRGQAAGLQFTKG